MTEWLKDIERLRPSTSQGETYCFMFTDAPKAFIGIDCNVSSYIIHYSSDESVAWSSPVRGQQLWDIVCFTVWPAHTMSMVEVANHHKVYWKYCQRKVWAIVYWVHDTYSQMTCFKILVCAEWAIQKMSIRERFVWTICKRNNASVVDHRFWDRFAAVVMGELWWHFPCKLAEVMSKSVVVFLIVFKFFRFLVSIHLKKMFINQPSQTFG